MNQFLRTVTNEHVYTESTYVSAYNSTHVYANECTYVSISTLQFCSANLHTEIVFVSVSNMWVESIIWHCKRCWNPFICHFWGSLRKNCCWSRCLSWINRSWMMNQEQLSLQFDLKQLAVEWLCLSDLIASSTLLIHCYHHRTGSRLCLDLCTLRCCVYLCKWTTSVYTRPSLCE